MTFEDWTDVMYETMDVYPLSWTFYLSFIFFTAFAFLNMVIGIVVNVMHAEAEKMQQDEKSETPEVSLQEVQQQLLRLQRLLEAQGQSGLSDQTSTKSRQ
jgi:voltage-gated sodium channel